MNLKHQINADQKNQILNAKNCMMIMIKIIRILKQKFLKKNFSQIHEKNYKQIFIKINQKLKLFEIS